MAGQLTGLRRHRIQTRWFRRPLVVLQVQYHDVEWFGSAFEYVVRWRDANVEDLTRAGAR